jgi:2-polyprenyl-3-methyl-5-hydroxy-6-metoxy-1,4-benzoquinol methylase
MAAALVLGDSVLDVGAGEAGLAHHLHHAIRYTGVDRTVVRTLNLDEACNHVFEGDAIEVMQKIHRRYDTVVCLEFIEHIDPATQRHLVFEMWQHTVRRLIISTPHPLAMSHYPRTDHFFGANNPHHTREVDEWWLRDVVGLVCGGVKGVHVFGHGLDHQDLPTWLQGPEAGWMAVIDRA